MRPKKGIRWSLLIVFACLAAPLAPAPPQQATGAPQAETNDSVSSAPDDDQHDQDKDRPLTGAELRRRFFRDNLKRAKSDAAAMAVLAKELRAELDKPNAQPLSPAVLKRLARIEKLARKIREETWLY